MSLCDKLKLLESINKVSGNFEKYNFLVHRDAKIAAALRHSMRQLWVIFATHPIYLDTNIYISNCVEFSAE